MKYFFSSPTGDRKNLFHLNVKNYLLSYAVDASECDHFDAPDRSIMIDSGAFTVWNKANKTGGKSEIDIDAYKNFCLTKPQNWTFINIDVIPKTGSSQKDIDVCCERGFENYLYLSKYIKNLMPVYHYGDDIKWLKKYMEYTDYIGVSPANDTHESVKRQFLKTVFKITKAQVKTHGLGYSSFSGLMMFPFYSVDSISYKKVHVYLGGQRKQFWRNNTMGFIAKSRIKEFLDVEKDITLLWERRGVSWS